MPFRRTIMFTRSATLLILEDLPKTRLPSFSGSRPLPLSHCWLLGSLRIPQQEGDPGRLPPKLRWRCMIIKVPPGRGGVMWPALITVDAVCKMDEGVEGGGAPIVMLGRTQTRQPFCCGLLPYALLCTLTWPTVKL